MPITQVKIHPAIGIARVGNSPDEYFIGPETADLPEVPSGGYKDVQCRVKRQAARFRVFAYHDDGSPPQELTAPQAKITWTVKLANTKDDTVHDIVASERAVTGVSASAVFDDAYAATVNVVLGELRTESDGRLLVLGGHGVAGDTGGDTYDDVSDGYVKATVVIGAATYEAVPAWVIVGPPDHAPGVRPIITLYDLLAQFANLPLPTQVSFRRDIYPILRAALRHRGVYQIGFSHSSLDAMFPLDQPARTAIVAKLKQEGGDMPLLTLAQLTNRQYEMMKIWRDNSMSYVDDWASPAQPLPHTPDELDRGPISHAIGASFNPGIECGNSMIDGLTVKWLEPFRINAAATLPGAATKSLWSPWQKDWKACGGTWWPSQRPSRVIPQGDTSYQDWDAGVADATDMRTKWHTLGFVVREAGDKMFQVERCDAPYIVLVTPALNFIDVPQGPGAVATSRLQAVVFEVTSAVAATFKFVSGADSVGFSRETMAPVVVGPTTGAPEYARLWVKYTTAAVIESVTATVTVTHTESGRQWVIPLAANTVAHQSAAVALVLDRSGSMSEPRGDLVAKMDSLKAAVDVFASVALEGDGISCVAFNQDVTGQLAVTALGPATNPNDPGRKAVKDFASLLTPGGTTSIGDGIDAATAQLAGAGGYDRTATVIITDGKENQPKWIAEVAGQITSTTYAVGIGRPDNVNVATLQTLTGNHGGYLLVTGPIASDNSFILTKYFLQILAGVSNADVVLDPQGVLVPGQSVLIPFQITDADLMFDVVVLAADPNMIDFRLITPLGHEITPANAGSLAQVEHVTANQTRFYRVRVPVEVVAQRPSHPGQWQARLEVAGAGYTEAPATVQTEVFALDSARMRGRRAPVRSDSEIRQAAPGGSAADARHTAPGGETTTYQGGAGALGQSALSYSVLVHTWSDVSLRAALHQPAASLGHMSSVTATLSYCGTAFRGECGAWLELTEPSGRTRQIGMASRGEGEFRAEFPTEQAGVYQARVRAQGRTARGWLFQREQTLTAAVAGGDLAVPGGTSAAWAEMLECLLAGGVSRKGLRRLARLGIDVAAVRDCLRRRGGDPHER